MLTARQRKEFDATVRALRETTPGREATMYTSLRDLFVNLLQYPGTSVVVDTAGTRGRPDLTVYAPGGESSAKVPWIVVEAKPDKGAVSSKLRRIKLFEEKAKYITADTAFFVMVDPIALVARSAGIGKQLHADIEVPWEELTPEKFLELLAPLHSSLAGVPVVLKRFRSGDEALIACDKLSVSGSETDLAKLAAQINRNVFFDGLQETTKLLQSACRTALAATLAERTQIRDLVGEFSAKYGGHKFRPYPIAIEGVSRTSREMEAAHRRDSANLRKYLVQRPALARLTLDALPRFAERTGIDLAQEGAKVEKFFTTETANLILARILLIRFLEDHGFFDSQTADGVVRRRYICNGGVKAFQGMREYFDFGYTRLLEEAYRTGGHFYAAAFDETEMDWVIAMSDPNLSRMVEWAMFRFARFDFATARGDLMTGVYDRFLDRRQRKEQGEYYTPPSIARYILSRIRALGVADTAEILDPACGSGTFLIERYRQIAGEDADRGLVTYSDARQAVERLYGNDINPFSSVLSQIQLLWHLFTFGSDIKTNGFPDLRIAERANSLVPGALYDPAQTRFGEIDRTGYDAVVGNPPYVRPERAPRLESHAEEYFRGSRTIGDKTFNGISLGRNIYNLFIYRALDHWCRQKAADGPVGKLGFVVPLSFCGSDESAELRKLFEVDGRWAIREIVDLELIWSEIFDADVLPMILIAEAVSAQAEDMVSIRLADDSCVIRSAGAKRPIFDFTKLPERHVRYADLFTGDGRIMTRLTPERVDIIKKLRANKTFSDAAMPYWTRRGRGGQRVSDTPPNGIGAAGWQKQALIKYGIALRGKVQSLPGGHTVYKGEHVSATMLSGTPTHRDLDVSKVSSPSVWAYQSILPDRMFAFPIIEQVPVAAPFDPSVIALENTVVVFGPRKDLASFPFDALLLSSVYSYWYVLTGRRSFQNKVRSHIYPTSVADLPWSESLLARAIDIEEIRRDILDACKNRYETVKQLRAAANGLGLQPLKDVVRRVKGARIAKTADFKSDAPFVLAVGAVIEDGNRWTLQLDEFDDHGIVFDRISPAKLAQEGLSLLDGDEVTWTSLLNARIPANGEMAAELKNLRSRFEPSALDRRIDEEIAKLDAIVGVCLGLSEEKIDLIRREMKEDPFLSSINPRYPFFRPRQYGNRKNLQRGDRYVI